MGKAIDGHCMDVEIWSLDIEFAFIKWFVDYWILQTAAVSNRGLV